MFIFAYLCNLFYSKYLCSVPHHLLIPLALFYPFWLSSRHIIVLLDCSTGLGNSYVSLNSTAIAYSDACSLSVCLSLRHTDTPHTQISTTHLHICTWNGSAFAFSFCFCLKKSLQCSLNLPAGTSSLPLAVHITVSCSRLAHCHWLCTW